MIKIITFRDFDIILDNKSIIGEIGNNQKMIKLLKYFLIHRGMKLLPERIIDDLWIGEDRKNSKSMLKTQINRLTEIIPLNNMDEKAFFNIDFINGYYLFTLEEGCNIDLVEFEKDCINLEECSNKTISNIKEILLPCKRDFLVEIKEVESLPSRISKNDRLYIKNYKII